MIAHSLGSVTEAPAGAATVGRVCKVSDTDAASFQIVRQRLFGIAYRVLGSASEADDVVQDAWIRWQGTDRGKIRDPAAFLATMTARVALTVGQSARARHEITSGALQADAVDLGDDPSRVAEQGEALELALLALLEKLSATERAAYILREAFDYPYRGSPRCWAQRGERRGRYSRARAAPRRTTEGWQPITRCSAGSS